MDYTVLVPESGNIYNYCWENLQDKNFRVQLSERKIF
jgi:hypothetical protein